MQGRIAFALASLVVLAPAGAAAAEGGGLFTFRRDVLPILQARCVECHGPMKASGGLKLHNGSGLLEGGISGKAVVAGDSKKSYLVQRLLGEGGEDRMPLKADKLRNEELALIARWIDDGAQVPPEDPTIFIPAPGGLRRLTVGQYRNTLRSLLGETIKLPVELEPDTQVANSAAVGAARVPMSPRATELFAAAAVGAAADAVRTPAWRTEWAPCGPTDGPRLRGKPAEERACAEALIKRFGRRAFRRALTPEEMARYGRVHARALTASRDFWKATEVAVGAMMQSPHLLYRVEVGVPDPQDAKRRVLTGFELASRLSFFLWGEPPDDDLLDAAETGRMSTEEGLREQAERMLGSPRSRQTVLSFFTELLRLRRLDRLPQFRSKFRMASRTLGPAMRTETLKVIEEIAFDEKRDFREIFDTRATYVNGELAKLYGLPTPNNEGEFVRVAVPDGVPRTGILGHASFLALNAHPTSSSPTKRGKFIREVLLCQAVPPPPPNVSTQLPEDHEDGKPRTLRQKLDVHRTAPQCMGCHKAMDPMGLAFETFDGIGVFREKENGLPIDASGELDGIPFRNAAELGSLLRKSSRVATCLARSLYRYALGHLEGEGEEPIMDELAKGLERDGYRFRSLVLNVIKSRGFRFVSAQDPVHE